MRQRVVRHPLDAWVDPVDAFVALYGAVPDVVWLDDSMGSGGGFSYMGRAARVVTSADTDVFALLRSELPTNSSARSTAGASGTPRFELGWVGWLGYEMRSVTMGENPSYQSRYPDAALAYLDRAIAFDHSTRTVQLISLADAEGPDAEEWRRSVTDTLTEAASGSSANDQTMGATPPQTPAPVVRWEYSDSDYLAMVADCQRAIVAGDAYQLCLTTQATVDTRPDPLTTYLALRTSSPSHHGAYFSVGPIAVLSASPEQFLSVSPDGIVTSRPIKGTRRRDPAHSIDSALRDELESNEKERAENLMIVDLMRNDIARVSAVGSVEVTALLEVESYAHVHQLVSTIRGRLDHGRHGIDAVEACFPAGSMTGAPKLSATRILDGLERRARGIYSGAFGYFSLDGSIDLAMVIRTIVIDDDGATVGTGGGITALSNPEEELAEVRLKAAALLAVLGVNGG